MSNYINQVSDSLKNHISELANNPCLFLRNPNVDFSRKRKIDFKTFIGIMMNSGGATMSKELLDFFDFNKNTPSVSAFTQQRSKVLPEAFEYLFKSFTDDNLPTTNNYHGYRLIACEGSNLTIATNQKDARLLLYNYCELITTHVIKQMKNNDKTKQVNFTIAIYICREGRMKKLSFFHTPFLIFFDSLFLSQNNKPPFGEQTNFFRIFSFFLAF